MNPKLYNSQDLAKALNRSRTYVHAMKANGFKFSHGMRTTVESAVVWLAEHPEFRSSDYPALPKHPPSRTGARAGKCGESSLKHG